MSDTNPEATETPVEGGAAVETDPATPATPAEGEPAVEQTPEQIAAAAADAEAAAKAKPVEIPEDVLKAAALKHANGTMAAARRAEARVEAVKAENTTLKSDVQTYREFVQQLRQGDPEALRRVGFGSTKEFIDAIVAHGKEKPAPTAEERVAALEAERAAEKAERTKGEARAAVEQAKTAVFAAVDAKVDKYDLVTTDVGHDALWEAIETYHAEHGECPDSAVWALADAVETALATKLAKSKKFNGQSRPANNGTPAEPAEPASLNPGKTLTSKGSAGAPTVKEYSPDDNVRRKQLADELRAEGLL